MSNTSLRNLLLGFNGNTSPLLINKLNQKITESRFTRQISPAIYTHGALNVYKSDFYRYLSPAAMLNGDDYSRIVFYQLQTPTNPSRFLRCRFLDISSNEIGSALFVNGYFAVKIEESVFYNCNCTNQQVSIKGAAVYTNCTSFEIIRSCFDKCVRTIVRKDETPANAVFHGSGDFKLADSLFYRCAPRGYQYGDSPVTSFGSVIRVTRNNFTNNFDFMGPGSISIFRCGGDSYFTFSQTVDCGGHNGIEYRELTEILTHHLVFANNTNFSNGVLYAYESQITISNVVIYNNSIPSEGLLALRLGATISFIDSYTNVAFSPLLPGITYKDNLSYELYATLFSDGCRNPNTFLFTHSLILSSMSSSILPIILQLFVVS